MLGSGKVTLRHVDIIRVDTIHNIAEMVQYVKLLKISYAIILLPDKSFRKLGFRLKIFNNWSNLAL